MRTKTSSVRANCRVRPPAMSMNTTGFSPAIRVTSSTGVNSCREGTKHSIPGRSTEAGRAWMDQDESTTDRAAPSESVLLSGGSTLCSLTTCYCERLFSLSTGGFIQTCADSQTYGTMDPFFTRVKSPRRA